MISDTQALVQLSQVEDKVPEKFKQEVGAYLKQLNPKEDQKDYLKKELKKNQFEEKTMPNTLLFIQEAKTVPFGKGNDLTRSMYVNKIKAVDAQVQSLLNEK